MEQEIALKKEGQALGFLKPLVAKLTPKFQKGDIFTSLKKAGITIISILLFLGLWHMGSKALYNVEADYKVE